MSEFIMRTCRRSIPAFLVSVVLFGAPLSAQNAKPPFRDESLPLEHRVRDLVSRLTLVEKVAQMQHEAPAIERMGIPAYNWWNEALHGVARAGMATVFPQAIGLAATFDPGFLHRVASAIGTEARAKHHEAVRQGRRGIYEGLTFWSPNINIARDPRWGRAQETYGEDPWLAGTLGVSFARGLQGDDARYLRAVATPKHFAVHSGPEPSRHAFNALVSEQDLHDTYLPAFRRVVREAGAASVMCAYNRLYGDPCCANSLLLDSLLRREWGFDGYVVSDCWAVSDYVNFHKVDSSMAEAAARSVNAGCDLTCGPEFAALREAVARGLVAETTIDRAVRRLFTARFRLGMFDDPAHVTFASTPFALNACAAHDSLSLLAAEKSMVLLKNADGVLPLPRALRGIAVVGPNADDSTVLLGNYHGTPPHCITVLRGIRDAAGAGARVRFAKGCDWARAESAGAGEAHAEALLREARDAAADADFVIAVLGLHPSIEGEELQTRLEGFRGGDRTMIELPVPQQRLLEEMQASGKPLIVVLLGGSAIASPWMKQHADAILVAWYPGQNGGAAVARTLFGDVNPGGRLPVTFYASTDQLPAFDDYSMRERSYRFFKGVPMYAFGHGLSYTRFRYSDLRASSDSLGELDDVTLLLTIENTGDHDGDEVVQVYARDPDASAVSPRMELRGVQRVRIDAGARRTVAFTLTHEDRLRFDAALGRDIHPRRIDVMIGASSDDIRARIQLRFAPQ